MEGVTCVYSGVQEGRAKVGVAIYIVEELALPIMVCKYISERMVLVRLKIRRSRSVLFKCMPLQRIVQLRRRKSFFGTLQDTVSCLQ